MMEKKIRVKTALAVFLGTGVVTLALGGLLTGLVWWNKFNINWGAGF